MRNNVAALFDADSVSLVIHVGVGTALLVAIGASLASPRKRSAPMAATVVNTYEFEDSVRWSVMTVLSFLPYFNFASWAFAAVDSTYSVQASCAEDNSDDSSDNWGTQDDASYYWSLAFLYAIPYVVEGFRVDAFVWATVVMGATHVQVERARYYQEGGDALLPDLGFLCGLRLPRVTFSRISEGVGAKRGTGDDDVDQEADRLLAELDRDELSDFDRRLRDRSRNSKGE